MDQFGQIDSTDPFFSPPPLSTPPTDASDALALPALATYPSREALFEAIQSWAKARGYAFTVGKSKRVLDGRQKVYYACDRHSLLKPHTGRVRSTQSRGSGCLFSILALETLTLGWEVRYRPESKFNTHNHPPSQGPVAHPSHRRLPITVQNTAQRLFSAGNYYSLYN
jgi:hypothetical protein